MKLCSERALAIADLVADPRLNGNISARDKEIEIEKGNEKKKGSCYSIWTDGNNGNSVTRQVAIQKWNQSELAKRVPFRSVWFGCLGCPLEQLCFAALFELAEVGFHFVEALAKNHLMILVALYCF